MKKLSLDSEREQDGLDINLTPLIDVVFILLIFFMVSSSFEKKNHIPINRPQARSAEAMPPQQQQTILFTLTQQGAILLEGEAITLVQIQARLAHYLMQTRELSVLIDADKAVSTGELIQLIDQIRLAHISDIGLLSQRKE